MAAMSDRINFKNNTHPLGCGMARTYPCQVGAQGWVREITTSSVVEVEYEKYAASLRQDKFRRTESDLLGNDSVKS